MLPGINPKQMQKAMRQMGIKQEEIDAIAVIVRTKTEDIIIRNPSIQKINMSGQISYQVSGEEEHRPIEQEIEISEEDITTVMKQANITKKDAETALKKNKGDLAAAILSFQK